ncbi:MAG: beta-propeller fold lactonase family protein [Microlunatus sp.]
MSSTSGLRHVFVGGYTAEADGRATGITSLLNTGSDHRVQLEPVATAELRSPTWLVRHPTLPVLLAAGETNPGTLSSVRWDQDGTLTTLSTVEVAGDGACHLTITDDGRHALVASYVSGIVSVVAIADDGTLAKLGDHLGLVGSGPVTDRQEGPHAHQIVVVGDEILCCDLGGDQIHRLRLNAEGVLYPAHDPIRLPAGSGPRHLVVAQDHLVVALELSGELWLGKRHETEWVQAQVVPTSTRDGHVQPSGIDTDGSRIYVASRGVDTVAAFDLDPVESTLTPVAEFDCGGVWPRAITLDGGLLWVSNESSHNVAIFEVSPLPPTGPVTDLALPSPTGVVLVHDEAAHDGGSVVQ